MIESEAKKNWSELWKNSSAPSEKVELFWDMVYRAYNEKSRYYHSLTHIEQMLHSCNLYNDKIEDIQNVKRAIFYHDIVYVAKRNDNELKSSILAAQHLNELKCLPYKIDKCCKYILSTIGHNSSISENDLNFFLDFDLENWVLFRQNTLFILKESGVNIAFIPI
jgi:predicted metal-dependent HD superfamily phosphohydrolase